MPFFIYRSNSHYFVENVDTKLDNFLKMWITFGCVLK